jgi:hypothetical protein
LDFVYVDNRKSAYEWMHALDKQQEVMAEEWEEWMTGKNMCLITHMLVFSIPEW